MVEKRYQVFISSTFADLKDERQAAMNSVIDLHHIPIGMEGFPAIDQEQMSYICRLIDECDYYVLIIKNRYGSVGPNGISFTEQEYDYAMSVGKHVLVFVNDSDPIDDCDAPDQLIAFRQKATKGRIAKFWTDKASLELAVFKSLTAAFSADPRVGWVRGDHAADPIVAQQLEGARQEILALKKLIKPYEPPADIAGLDHQVVVKYTYSYRGERRNSSKTMSLEELFVAVASGFKVWKTESEFQGQLDNYMSYIGINLYGFQVEKHFREMILNQFELLGVMESAVLQATSGGSFVYYRVTQEGSRLLKTRLAIKANAG